MKRQATLSLFAILAVLAVSSLAFGNPIHHRGDYGHGHAMTIPGPAIQLSAEQQDGIQKLRDAHQERMADLRDAFIARHLELESKVNSGKATRADIETLLKDMRSIRVQMSTEREDFRAKAAAIAGVDCQDFPLGPCSERGFGHRFGHGCGPCGNGYGGFGHGFGCDWDDGALEHAPDQDR